MRCLFICLVLNSLGLAQLEVEPVTVDWNVITTAKDALTNSLQIANEERLNGIIQGYNGFYFNQAQQLEGLRSALNSKVNEYNQANSPAPVDLVALREAVEELNNGLLAIDSFYYVRAHYLFLIENQLDEAKRVYAGSYGLEHFLIADVSLDRWQAANDFFVNVKTLFPNAPRGVNY